MTTTKADCPGCGKTYETHNGYYWCPICQCEFDDQPDEGGDYDSRNPAARLEREERRKEREQQRRQHRRHPR